MIFTLESSTFQQTMESMGINIAELASITIPNIMAMVVVWIRQVGYGLPLNYSDFNLFVINYFKPKIEWYLNTFNPISLWEDLDSRVISIGSTIAHLAYAVIFDLSKNIPPFPPQFLNRIKVGQDNVLILSVTAKSY